MNDGGEIERWRLRTFGLASGAGHAAIVVGLLLSAVRPRTGEMGSIPATGVLEIEEAPSFVIVPPDVPGPGRNDRAEARSIDSPTKTSAPLPVHEAARASAPVADRRESEHAGEPTLPGTEREPGADEGTEVALAADAGAAPATVGEDVLARGAGGDGTSGGGQNRARARAPGPPSMDLSRGPIPPPLDRWLESLYPIEAQRARVGGTARVRVLVRRDGSVGGVARLSESRDGFGGACEETMKISGRWKAAVDAGGMPVDEEALVTCRFVLPERR